MSVPVQAGPREIDRRLVDRELRSDELVSDRVVDGAHLGVVLAAQFDALFWHEDGRQQRRFCQGAKRRTVWSQCRLEEFTLVQMELWPEVNERQRPQPDLCIDPRAAERLEQEVTEVLRQMSPEDDGFIDAVRIGRERGSRGSMPRRRTFPEVNGGVDPPARDVIQAEVAGHEEGIFEPVNLQILGGQPGTFVPWVACDATPVGTGLPSSGYSLADRSEARYRWRTPA